MISGINLAAGDETLAASDRCGGQPPSAVRASEARLHPSTALIRAILAETTLEKLRISSVEPMDWSDELISLVASSPRIAKHAHVPMQSGSDAVLRRMHRKYRPWHYREKIEKIRAAMPDAAIGADVMVGFPGETDAEFEETRQHDRRAALHLPARLYVFRAPGHSGRGHAESGSGAHRARTQPHLARTGGGEEAGLHARLRRQDSGSDHAECRRHTTRTASSPKR